MDFVHVAIESRKIDAEQADQRVTRILASIQKHTEDMRLAIENGYSIDPSWLRQPIWDLITANEQREHDHKTLRLLEHIQEETNSEHSTQD